MREHAWRKSSRSGSAINCVEVALTSENVAVRDSKTPEDGHLTVTHDQWRSFLRTLDPGHAPG